MSTILAAVSAASLIVPLASGLAGAAGTFAVAWRKITVLDTAQAEKLAAEKQDIIATAETRATDKALKALEFALRVAEEQRDAALAELRDKAARVEELERRVAELEHIVERRRIEVAGAPRRRSTD